MYSRSVSEKNAPATHWKRPSPLELTRASNVVCLRSVVSLRFEGSSTPPSSGYSRSTETEPVSALASRLNRPPLAALIQQEYELVFVDVGFLDKGREVVQQFGVPQFYATPTLLIIDPSSGALINDEDRHMWANAYSIDMPSSVQYFEKWATTEPVPDPAAAAASTYPVSGVVLDRSS